MVQSEDLPKNTLAPVPFHRVTDPAGRYDAETADGGVTGRDRMHSDAAEKPVVDILKYPGTTLALKSGGLPQALRGMKSAVTGALGLAVIVQICVRRLRPLRRRAARTLRPPTVLRRERYPHLRMRLTL